MSTGRFHRAIQLALIGACLLCAGCIRTDRIYQDVHRHRSGRYAQWRSEREGRGGVRQILTGSLSLAESQHIALANSRRIRTIVLEREKASQKVRGAYAEALPSVALEGNYTRLDRRPGFGGGVRGPENNYSLQGVVTQPLYRGGLITAGVRAARLFSLLVNEQERGVYQDVLFNVRKAYYDALLAAELVRASDEAVSVARRRLGDVQQDRKVGRASDFDVLRAEVEVKNLVATLVAEQNRYRLAVASLLNLMGVSQESNITLTHMLRYDPIHPTVEEAVETAFHKHPGLLQRELETRVQKEAVNVARSDHFPELDFFFTQGVTRPHPFDATQDRWEDAWSTGLNLTWSLFSGFRTVAKVREEKAALRQREVALRDAEENVLLAIRQAMLNLEDAARLVESQAANVEQAREALRLSELAFKEGSLKEIDFLDTRRALTRARATYAQALYSYELARLEYERATGALKPPEAAPEAPPDAPPTEQQKP